MYRSSDTYTLAAVTKQGYGCGNTRFPGIYINITNPIYLTWIKDNAFWK